MEHILLNSLSDYEKSKSSQTTLHNKCPRMSNERIDITEMEEHLKLGLWTDNTSLDLLAELKRSYKELDDLKWNHMQVLRGRKDVRDELYRMAMKSGLINRQIQEMIDACDGVDSLYGEEVVGMLKEILA